MKTKIGQHRRDPLSGKTGELVRVFGKIEVYRAEDGSVFQRITGKSKMSKHVPRKRRGTTVREPGR